MGRYTYIICLFLACAVIPVQCQVYSDCKQFAECTSSLIVTLSESGIRLCRMIVEYIACVQKSVEVCPNLDSTEVNKYMPTVSTAYNNTRCTDLLREITTAPGQSISTDGYDTSERIASESPREATSPLSTSFLTRSILITTPKPEVTSGMSTEITSEKEKSTVTIIPTKLTTSDKLSSSTPNTEMTSGISNREGGISSMMTVILRWTSLSDRMTSIESTSQMTASLNTDNKIRTTTSLGSETRNVYPSSTMSQGQTTVLNTEGGNELTSTNAMTSSRTTATDAKTEMMTTPINIQQSSTTIRDVSTGRETTGNRDEMTSFHSVTSDASTQKMTSQTGYRSTPISHTYKTWTAKRISSSPTKETTMSTSKSSAQHTGQPNVTGEENHSNGGTKTFSVGYVLAVLTAIFTHRLS